MKKTLIAGALYALPLFVLAQTTLVTVVTTLGRISNTVLIIVGVLLTVFFFVGVIGYVNAGGEEEKRAAARDTMIYSVIGMFVAFSIFGLVALLGRTFGVGSGGTEGLPFVNDSLLFQ